MYVYVFEYYIAQLLICVLFISYVITTSTDCITSCSKIV